MTSAPKPANEEERLAALDEYQLLDTEPETIFSAFVKLAATICGVPIALVSLIDEKRQWFKANLVLRA